MVQKVGIITDKIDELVLKTIDQDNINLKISGFHWKSYGRCATIYYVDNLSIVPIGCEMPGVDYLDILVFGETKHINKRYYIKERKAEILSFEERIMIQELLVKWLSEKGLKHDIVVGQ
jgi:hypothetical protein